jgi:hypothetical protein
MTRRTAKASLVRAGPNPDRVAIHRSARAFDERTIMRSTEFVDWYCSEPRLAFNCTVVLRYRIHLEQRHLAPTTINLHLAAVRRVAYEAADSGLLSPELAAGIRRVKGVRRIGVRLGNWLSADQSRSLLLNAQGDSLRSKRNYAILALCHSCFSD